MWKATDEGTVTYDRQEPIRSEVRNAFTDSLRILWVVLAALGALALVPTLFMKVFALSQVTDENWGMKEEKKVKDVESGEKS
jgi:hypothetical protein